MFSSYLNLIDHPTICLPLNCEGSKDSFGIALAVDVSPYGVYIYGMGKNLEKPRIGRPPVDEPLKKRFFRCSDAEWDKLCELAEDGNRSQLIRGLIAKEISRQSSSRK